MKMPWPFKNKRDYTPKDHMTEAEHDEENERAFERATELVEWLPAIVLVVVCVVLGLLWLIGVGQ